MDDVTLCIKSFDRHPCLERLLESIRTYYPDVPILIADDGRECFLRKPAQVEKFQGMTLRVLQMPFDSGMSAGRNLMVQEAKTSRLILLDDDFIFNDDTQLERLVEGLEQGYDIVAGYLRLPGGREQHYEGFMIQSGDQLLLFRIEGATEIVPVDIVLNFFAARRDALQTITWDEQLKICEHEDFFWRGKQAGLRVGFCPHVWAWHQRGRNVQYNRFRNSRVKEMKAIAMEKHGWADQRWFAL